MGIKEIKGRSLPGRSEEPSPDRPTTTISEVGSKRAATEHQRERSEFEQRKGSKAPRRVVKKGPELETSEFERGGRAIPRLNDPADDLERYPYPGQAGRHSIQEWVEQWPAAEKASEPDRMLWGDGYEGEGGDSAAEHEGAEFDSEEEIARELDPVVEDLWIASGAAARVVGAEGADVSVIEVESSEGNEPGGAGAGPKTPVATQEGSVSTRSGAPDLWETAATQVEMPVVEIPRAPPAPQSAPRVLAPIPRGAQEYPPGESPTQEVTAINALPSDGTRHPLGEDIPTPTEGQDSPDPRSQDES